MRSLVQWVASAAVASSLAWSVDASACSCVAPDIIHDYNISDSVIIGQVIAQTQMGPFIVYTTRVLRDLKGCRAPGTTVRIGSPDSPAACGAFLPSGVPILIFSSESTVPGGSRQLTTSSCMPNIMPSMLTRDERAFLSTRPITCGTATTCADGSAPYTCLVDPCSVTPACPGAVCRSNYCGGCTAEFYDPSRYAACLPW
jgi:hypothetical protein